MQVIYQLKIIKGNDVGLVFEIKDGVYIIGRAFPDSKTEFLDKRNLILIKDTEISKKHAKLNILSGELVIEDFGSTNGIFVNNKRVKKSLLFNNDELKVGKTTFSVFSNINKYDRTFLGDSSKYSKQSKDFKKMAKIAEKNFEFEPVMDSLDKDFFFYDIYNELIEYIDKKSNQNEVPTSKFIKTYFFEVSIIGGNNKGERYRFYRKNIKIGRLSDISLDDELLSREHAEIEIIEDGKFKLTDLSSQNGCFINNIKVKTASFESKDTIKIGSSIIQFSNIDDNS